MRKAMARPIRLLLLILAVIAGAFAHGQDQRFHKWEATVSPADIRAGETGVIKLTATIDDGWHVYEIGQTGGPQGMEIEVAKNPAIAEIGKPIAPKAKRKHDPNFEVEVGYYEKTVTVEVPFKLAPNAKGEVKASVLVISQVCDATMCDRPREDKLEVAIPIAEGEPRTDRTTMALGGTGAASGGGSSGTVNQFDADFKQAQSQGLPSFILFSFVAGLAALLTPCVFPMIPVTVSFFSKKSEDGGKPGYGQALLYCLGIILTFTVLGIIVTLAFGASGLQSLSTNPFVNGALFLLFVVLALSLFGVFELRLPASLTTAASAKSRSAGWISPLLMGFTFSLTSFTCTVPVVGSILGGAAAGGNLLYPIVGMLAFSSALALPFFFLALFPALITKLPRSGSWMLTVKAFMGFLELAAAVKFLSNIDLVYQWGLITKPVFLALWAIIMAICGFYLFGWLRLPSETSPNVGWLRRGFAAASIAAAVYCLGGLQGVNLGTVAAFLPPDDYGVPVGSAASKESEKWMTDLEAAKALARKEGKKLFIDFTGVACTNCRWMEKNMFPNKEVQDRFDDMVLVKLYTDRLRPEEARRADEKNRELQLKWTNSTTLPVYVILTPDEEPLKVGAYTTDKDAFVKFLDAGLNSGVVAKN
jgi:thiol:disulfide interchange protein